MKKLFSLAALFFAMLAVSQGKSDLEGTWTLKSYIDHSDGGKTKFYEDHILFQKHIAGCHFAWIKYDTREMKLIGMGGGTFQIDENDNYVETLEFFYPFGSSEHGQSIVFDKEVKGGKWYHSGYVKDFALDNDGELTVIDSIKIEEVWIPFKSKSKQSELVGTWILQKSRTSKNQEYEEMPEMIDYFRIMTPSHFFSVKFDAEGDQIYGAVVGTYSLKDDLYNETVQASYPQNIGNTMSMQYVREGKIWKYIGELESSSGTQYIDELWKPHVCRPTMAGMTHD